ncbi:MAG: hypothetical protein KHZ15_06930 [Coprobacillus cateniformis]|uniref:hypothetical protein n=1 Tax=Longibaculum muris TaxID=1796628 RepID=UPI003AB6512E|nr:hypothetical protein [Coprobacillus cateniformis]
MKELQMPIIYDQQQRIGYGGNQDWFHDEWAQKAGCASVLASNLYAFYQQQEKYNKDEFLGVMEEMFNLMTPGNMGYPFLYKFARTFIARMKQDNCYLKPVYQKKSKNYKHALDYVLKSIDEGHPVGMLILHHRAKELEEDNWHWICLSGYIESESHYRIVFSDCGMRREIDSRILFDTHHHNVFKMVRMQNDPTK